MKCPIYMKYEFKVLLLLKIKSIRVWKLTPEAPTRNEIFCSVEGKNNAAAFDPLPTLPNIEPRGYFGPLSGASPRTKNIVRPRLAHAPTPNSVEPT